MAGRRGRPTLPVVDAPGELISRFAPDDPAFIANPYPVLNGLREATPVFRYEPTGQWVVTRFDDVSALLRHPSLGRNYLHRYTSDEFGRPGPDPRWARFNDHERWSLLFLEPPDHPRIRRLVAAAFSRRALAGLAERMRGLSEALLDQCEERQTFDLLSDYAQPFSVGVISSLLGLPTGDEQQLLDWSHAIVKMYEVSAPDATKRAADEAAGAFIDYVAEILQHKRDHPDDTLISHMAQVANADGRLSDPEIISTTMVLLEAGHEATVNTLGNGFRALMEHPAQWRRLVVGEVGAATAVEELLRWDSPLQLFARFVLEPGVQVGGLDLPVGDEVAMLFGSAQRDPRRFSDPDRFDIGRGVRSHIGFGGGIHFCIGAELARAELTESVGGLVHRFPRLQLSAPPHYHQTFVLRGLAALMLRSE